MIPNMLSRASELISLGERARAAIKGHPSSVMRDPALYAEFRTAGLSFLANLFGKEHSYYKDFDSRVRRAAVDEIGHGIGVMRAVQGEISAGWLESTRQLIAAEVFTDFLEMADHLLQEGYKDAAAVMIGGVLEGRLKGLAVKNGIAVGVMKDGVDVPKKADRLNSELAAGGVYAKLDQKNVTAWLDLRNKAAHADYTSYTLEQVKLMRASVADFLARCT